MADVNKIPLSEIETGFIGVRADNSKICFVRFDGKLCYNVITSSGYETLLSYRLRYPEDGTYTDSNQKDLIKIFKPLEEKDGILQAEPFWDRNICWSQVAVDTPIYVRNYIGHNWNPRHFSHYADGEIFCFEEGRTSFTAKHTIGWKYAKLVEKEKEG